MDKQFQQQEIASNSWSIRSATGKDLDQLASLTSRGSDWATALSNELHHKNIRILVAEQDDQVVGFIHFRVVSRGIDAVENRLKRFLKRQLGMPGNEFEEIIRPIQYGVIQEICVIPGMRKRGIAKALIDACTDYSNYQQISELQVEIHPEDESLLCFFRGIGFNDSRYTVQRRLPKRLPLHKEYIRIADQGDLPQLSELVKKQILHQQSLADSFELLPDIDWSRYVLSIIKNRGAVLLVADQNGHLTGFFEAWIYRKGVYGVRANFSSIARGYLSTSPKQPELFGVMEHVYVLPEFRKRDVAQNLVLGAANWFRDQGAEEVLGSVWANNESTLKLTRVIGFKVVRVILSKRI